MDRTGVAPASRCLQGIIAASVHAGPVTRGRLRRLFIVGETTTTFEKLERIPPESETHWRAIAARAHRLIGRTGHEAAAKTHELHIHEIREALLPGTSRQIRFCPRCMGRGRRYALIWIAGTDRCGTCDWPGADRLATESLVESSGLAPLFSGLVTGRVPPRSPRAFRDLGASCQN